MKERMISKDMHGEESIRHCEARKRQRTGRAESKQMKW